MRAAAHASRSSEAFTRVERLRASRDFDTVMREARPVRHRLLILRTRPNGLAYSRLGYTVGKRVGNAVARNRVRRRLRAAMRAVPLAPGHDLVVSASPAAVTARFDELAAACKRSAAKAGVVTGESV